MLIFLIGLLLAVIVLGLATAHISKLKQQRRELSDNSVFECVNVEPRSARAQSSIQNSGERRRGFTVPHSGNSPISQVISEVHCPERKG